MLEIQKFASFDPFKIRGFFCPVCGSLEFVELRPHGGVWCKNCNAAFIVTETCDVTPVSVKCTTENVWRNIVKQDGTKYDPCPFPPFKNYGIKLDDSTKAKDIEWIAVHPRWEDLTDKEQQSLAQKDKIQYIRRNKNGIYKTSNS